MNLRYAVGTLGIIICILSIFFGLYVGIWVCLAGGIIDIVTGFTSDPVMAKTVAIGAIKFIFAGVIGWISGVIGFFGGVGLITLSDSM